MAKGIWLTLVCFALIANSSLAVAQITLACQFETGGQGLYWHKNNWLPSTFPRGKPFFLIINPDKRIDRRSALNAMGLGNSADFYLDNMPNHLNCTNTGGSVSYGDIRAGWEGVATCTWSSGDSVRVGLRSLRGAIAKLSQMAEKDDGDHEQYSRYVSVSVFVCQKL